MPLSLISKYAPPLRQHSLFDGWSEQKSRRNTFGGLAVCISRPMTLRPCLTAGLPFRGRIWTACQKQFHCSKSAGQIQARFTKNHRPWTVHARAKSLSPFLRWRIKTPVQNTSQRLSKTFSPNPEFPVHLHLRSRRSFRNPQRCVYPARP